MDEGHRSKCNTCMRVKACMDVPLYTKVLRFINESSSPQTLEEVKGGTEDSEGVEMILGELIARGEIVSKSIPCGPGPESAVRVYWKTFQHPPTASKSTTKSNAFTTPTSCMRPPSKRSRLPFKSPAKVLNNLSPSTPVSCQKDGAFQNSLKKKQRADYRESEEELSKDIRRLKAELKEIDAEITELKSEDCDEHELQSHIDALHEYNEMKDIGQILLGKIAEHEGTTTASLYERFGLDIDS